MASRRPLGWLLAPTAVLAATAALVAGSPGLADDGDELHGAMPMDQQQEELQSLLGDRDPTVAPRVIDPDLFVDAIPEGNELTRARIELGRELYFETRLSSDGTVSCATCHDVSRGFTDQRETSEGVGGALGKRNSPTTANAMFHVTQFLDGRSASLEEQAALPPVNPIEMGQPDEEAVVAGIADDEAYQAMFREAYGSDPNFDDLVKAIASFERTLIFLDSPFYAFLQGDEDAISAEAKRGWVLYNGKGRCVSCHQINPSNPIGTDHMFHNIGVSARAQDFEQLAGEALAALQGKGVQAVDELATASDMSELGRFMVTKDRADIGAFKTQQVANIGLTAPYMHDGSMATLWDVMDHYNRGGEANPFLDGGIEPLDLSEDEIDALVALMFAMTDRRFADQNAAEMKRQRAIAAESRPFRDEALASGRVLLFEQRVQGEE